MKSSLRLTVQSVIVIFALFFIIPLFIPSSFTITVSRDIHAPASRVFGLVNNLRNRKAWSPFEQDSTLKIRYQGPAAGTGAQSFRSSKKSGKGSIKIIRSVTDKTIDTRLNFDTPETITGHWKFTSPKNGYTRVTWQLTIKGLHYPLGRWLGLFLKKSVRQILSEGLDALKIISEKKPEKSSTEGK
jgi:ribosome-associated toxin RatA of RatAB toxin-antitoxin module